MDTVYTRCVKLYLPQYKLTTSDNNTVLPSGTVIILTEFCEANDNDTDGVGDHTITP